MSPLWYKESTMKLFCYNCGAEIIPLSLRRKYCSNSCAQIYRSRIKQRTVSNYFPLFKNIVAASADANEFKQLYQKYFVEAAYEW